MVYLSLNTKCSIPHCNLTLAQAGKLPTWVNAFLRISEWLGESPIQCITQKHKKTGDILATQGQVQPSPSQRPRNMFAMPSVWICCLSNSSLAAPLHHTVWNHFCFVSPHEWSGPNANAKDKGAQVTTDLQGTRAAMAFAIRRCMLHGI